MGCLLGPDSFSSPSSIINICFPLSFFSLSFVIVVFLWREPGRLYRHYYSQQAAKQRLQFQSHNWIFLRTLLGISGFFLCRLFYGEAGPSPPVIVAKKTCILCQTKLFSGPDQVVWAPKSNQRTRAALWWEGNKKIAIFRKFSLSFSVVLQKRALLTRLGWNASHG